MTIGEGIAHGASNYLNRLQARRSLSSGSGSSKRRIDNSDEELAERKRQFDATREDSQARQQENARQFDANLDFRNRELDQRQNQYDQSHSWDDKLNQQRLETLKAQQDESAARMAHYQQLEEQSRQYAADLKQKRHTAMKDMFWTARNNGGFLTSPELLGEFTKRLDAPDLAGITSAGFFYNEDGTVKSPKNDDNKPVMFGISYNYVDPSTGKIAVDQNGNRVEKVMVPKFQDEWIKEGDIYSPTSIRSATSGVRGVSGGGTRSGGLTFDQQKELIEARKNTPRFDKDYYDALVAARNDIMYKPDGAGGYLKNEKNELDENQKKELAAINAKINEMLDVGGSTGGITGGSEGGDEGGGAIVGDEDTRRRAAMILAKRRKRAAVDGAK